MFGHKKFVKKYNIHEELNWRGSISPVPAQPYAHHLMPTGQACFPIKPYLLALIQ
jgi:hypothetical protein